MKAATRIDVAASQSGAQWVIHRADSAFRIRHPLHLGNEPNLALHKRRRSDAETHLVEGSHNSKVLMFSQQQTPDPFLRKDF